MTKLMALLFAAVLVILSTAATEMVGADMTIVTKVAKARQSNSFFVKLMESVLVADQGRVVFDTVTSDPTGSYSAGVFTCSESGTWVFTYTISSNTDGDFSLFINGLKISTIHGGIASHYSTGHSQVVIYCNVGMTVEIRKINGGSANVYGASESSFTGFLLLQNSNFFFVKLMENFYVNITEILVFDTVTSDPTGSYSAGVFTCPVSGTWVFTYTISSNTDGDFSLFLNNSRISVINAGIADNYITGHSQVVLYCNVGMTVAIRKFYGGDDYVHGDSYSAFTGFLLPSSNNYFFVKLVEDFLVADQEIVVFDTVTSDPTNSYSAGVFTCPASGTWVFTYTITGNTESKFSLFINGLEISTINVGIVDNYITGHSQVVLYCNVGMTVAIRKTNGSSANVDGKSYSTFSGFLLG